MCIIWEQPHAVQVNLTHAFIYADMQVVIGICLSVSHPIMSSTNSPAGKEIKHIDHQRQFNWKHTHTAAIFLVVQYFTTGQTRWLCKSLRLCLEVWAPIDLSGDFSRGATEKKTLWLFLCCLASIFFSSLVSMDASVVPGFCLLHFAIFAFFFFHCVLPPLRSV